MCVCVPYTQSVLWNVPSQIAAHGNVAAAHWLPYECTKCGRAMCSAHSPHPCLCSTLSPVSVADVVIAVIISRVPGVIIKKMLGLSRLCRWYGSVWFGSVRLVAGDTWTHLRSGQVILKSVKMSITFDCSPKKKRQS